MGYECMKFRCAFLVAVLLLMMLSVVAVAVPNGQSFVGFTAGSSVSIDFTYDSYPIDSTYADTVLVTVNGTAEPGQAGDVTLSGTNVTLSPPSLQMPNGGSRDDIDATFANANGDATATATIAVHTSDDPHTHTNVPAESTVKVCKITNITSSATSIDGTAIPTLTHACVAAQGGNYPYDLPNSAVSLQAVIEPTPSGSMPLDFLTWSGGSGMVDPDIFGIYHEPKATSEKATITATCGTSNFNMLVYILWANQTDYKPANGTNDGLFLDNTNVFGVPPTMTGIVAPVAASGFYQSWNSIQFTISPSALVTDSNANIIDNSPIIWDVNREQSSKIRQFINGAWQITYNTGGFIPDTINDSTDDEDNNPWDGNGHLYGNDGPASTPNILATVLVDRMNANEFVIVKIGTNNYVKCSGDFAWHAFRAVKWNGAQWVQDNAYTNEITTGHLDLGSGTAP